MLSPGDDSYREWALAKLDQIPPGHSRRRGREAEVRAVRLPGPANAAHRQAA
jgi:hypothetical protein